MILLTEDFTKQIESVLRPFLIQHGFSRLRMSHYRQYIKPFIHCIFLQKRSDGKAICVNLGVHLDFIPGVGSLSVLPVENIHEIDCIIRDRLVPKGMSDYWWPAEPPDKQVASIRLLMEQEGLPFFERFVEFPGMIGKITTDDIDSGKAFKVVPGMTQGGMILLLARVHDYIGQKEKTIQFAEYGLKNLGRGILLKPIFEEIIQRNKK